MELNLINLQFDNWGMSLETYLGDAYLPYRLFASIAIVVIVLRVTKIIKTRKGQK